MLLPATAAPAVPRADGLAAEKAQDGVVAQLIVIVQVLVAEAEGHDGPAESPAYQAPSHRLVWAHSWSHQELVVNEYHVASFD